MQANLFTEPTTAGPVKATNSQASEARDDRRENSFERHMSQSKGQESLAEEPQADSSEDKGVLPTQANSSAKAETVIPREPVSSDEILFPNENGSTVEPSDDGEILFDVETAEPTPDSQLGQTTTDGPLAAPVQPPLTDKKQPLTTEQPLLSAEQPPLPEEQSAPLATPKVSNPTVETVEASKPVKNETLVATTAASSGMAAKTANFEETGQVSQTATGKETGQESAQKPYRSIAEMRFMSGGSSDAGTGAQTTSLEPGQRQTSTSGQTNVISPDVKVAVNEPVQQTQASGAVPPTTPAKVQNSDISNIPVQTTEVPRGSAIPAEGQKAGINVLEQSSDKGKGRASREADALDTQPRVTTAETNAARRQIEIAHQRVQIQNTTQTSVAAQTAVQQAVSLTESVASGQSFDAVLGETAGLSQLLTEAVISPGTVHRPETPRLVAVQLAEAIATKGERNIEVALSPEELGRVKMRLSTSEAGVSVLITTERPETQDMMRRHIDQLAEEFRRMGFEDISFEFSSEGFAGEAGGDGLQDDSTGAGGHAWSEGATEAEESIAKQAQQNLRLGDTGLDMRI